MFHSEGGVLTTRSKELRAIATERLSESGVFAAVENLQDEMELEVDSLTTP